MPLAANGIGSGTMGLARTGERHDLSLRRPDIPTRCPAMTPVVIGFGVITIAVSGAALMLPFIRNVVARSQKRRRSKKRKNRPRIPHQRIDLSASMPGKADHATEPDSTPNTG